MKRQAIWILVSTFVVLWAMEMREVSSSSLPSSSSDSFFSPRQKSRSKSATTLSATDAPGLPIPTEHSPIEGISKVRRPSIAGMRVFRGFPGSRKGFIWGVERFNPPNKSLPVIKAENHTPQVNGKHPKAKPPLTFYCLLPW